MPCIFARGLQEMFLARNRSCLHAHIRLFCSFTAVLVAALLFARAGIAQSTVNIHGIQNDLPSSPYLGDSVTTTGIVIAVLSDGFYIENPDASWDSNVCTSEGIYVYTPSITPSSYVALQQSVTVTGVVQASNSSSYAGTQIYIASPDSSNLVVNSSGNSLPEAVTSSTLTQATGGTCSLYSAGAFGQWLPFEGMRVNVPSSSSLLVAGSTGGTLTPASQSAATNGQFWAVFTTTRPFRATGISELDTVPSSAPSSVARWSGNPQLLLVDTTTLGGTAINAAAGTEFTGSSNLIGIIDYHVSTQGYTGLLLTSSTVSSLTQGNTVAPTAVTTRAGGEVTLATQNLDSLTAAETNRIAKLASAIVTYEKSPDIVAVQGATPAALIALQSAIVSAGGPSYTLSTQSTADANGFVNAFFFNPAADFDGTPVVSQLFTTSNTYTTSSGSSATLYDRTPLALSVGILRTGIADYNIVVLNTSFLTRTSIDDSTLGPDIRNRRAQQAQQLATQILEPLEASGDHVFVTGGFDSFEFSDGYVDALGILDGIEPTNTDTGAGVTLYDSTYNTTALENTTTAATNLTANATNPATSRYTYVESGSAEQPDHILITPEMADLVSIDYARIGADFPVSSTYDTSTVARASSHDGIVAYFTIPYPTSTTVSGSPNPSQYDESVTFTASVSSTGGTPSGTVTFYDTDGTALGTATLDSGSATFAISSLSVGTHTITAHYNGSDAFETSSGTTTQTVDVDAASLVLASSTNPSYYGDAVTFTVTASSSGVTPTGTVALFDITTNTSLGAASLASGVATFSISSLSVGTHVLQATYGGDTTNSSTTSNTVSQVVLTVYTPVATLVCTPNPAAYGATVTCTDTLASTAGTPTGTVTFYDGSTSIGTATLDSGVATLTTSSLSVGTHALTGSYARNGQYLAVVSNTFDEIIASTFSLTISPTSRSIYTGESASYTLTVTPGSGFTLDVALTCAGVPSNTTCTLTPSTVSGGSGTSQLVIQTTAPSQATTASAHLPGRSWPLLAGLLLLFIPRRHSVRFFALLLAAVLSTYALTGCGGSGSLTGGTPVGTYTVSVTGTATDGSLTITQTADVTVQVKSLF